MKWFEEMIDRVNAGGISGEWATQSQVAASSAVDKLELPAIPDDAVVDLVGCLIDEVERLTEPNKEAEEQLCAIAKEFCGDARNCEQHPKTLAGFVVQEVGKVRAEIERLRALLDGYEAMEKSMKQEASG